jgi:hypothetical protein
MLRLTVGISWYHRISDVLYEVSYKPGSNVICFTRDFYKCSVCIMPVMLVPIPVLISICLSCQLSSELTPITNCIILLALYTLTQDMPLSILHFQDSVLSSVGGGVAATSEVCKKKVAYDTTPTYSDHKVDNTVTLTAGLVWLRDFITLLWNSTTSKYSNGKWHRQTGFPLAC